MNGWFSSVFHQPHPPSRAGSRKAERGLRRPADRGPSCARSGAIFNWSSARSTIRLGTKLDSVCSVQPYGIGRQEVERAEHRAGQRRRQRDANRARRRVGDGGTTSSAFASPTPTIDPAAPRLRFRPKGRTGIDTSTASRSAPATALPVKTAVPTRSATKRQSVRASLDPVVFDRLGSRLGLSLCERRRRPHAASPWPICSRAGSCARWTARRPRRPRSGIAA